MSDDIPFPYQVEGAAWLKRKKYALLADVMGLGKSCQVILASDDLTPPFLIICPAVARHHWRNEFRKFSARGTALKIALILSRLDLPSIAGADVVIISYDLALGEHRDDFDIENPLCDVIDELKKPWALVGLDECHFLKNRKAGRTSAVYECLLPYAARMWAISGTPAPNYSNELWPIMRAFGWTNLPYWDFVKRYCTTKTNKWKTVVVGSKRTDELRAILAPNILRRRKEEVLKDLPPLLFSDVVVAPTEVPVEMWERYFQSYVINRDYFYKDIERQTALIEGATAKKTVLDDGDLEILALLPSKVKELRRWVGLQKALTVAEIIANELDVYAYDKIVLFAVHNCVIDVLKERLKKYKPVVINGETAASKRGAIVHKFQTDPECRVFIGNIIAAGTAITLTASSEIAVVEADYVPGNNAQAVMRCHRIGQNRSVHARFFGLADTVDEKIAAAYKRKARLLSALFDAPDAVRYHDKKIIDPFED
jgi:SWI/SNF-related matrix-associated actin-dependent regulator 1 of chromatin subfamily A